MLTSLMPPIAALPAPATVTPAAGPGSGGGGGGGGPSEGTAPQAFARLLDAAGSERSAAERTAQSPADAAAPPPSGPAGVARTGTGRAAHKPGAEPSAAGTARAPTAAPAGAVVAAASADDAQEATEAAPTKDSDTPSDTPSDASVLLASLAATPRPVAAALTAATGSGQVGSSDSLTGKGTDADTNAASAAVATGAAKGRAGQASATASAPWVGAGATDRAPSADRGKNAATATDALACPGAEATEAKTGQAAESHPWRAELQAAAGASTSAADALPASPAASAAPAPGSGPAAATNATGPTAGHLSAHPGSAEFAPQLGAQITSFVREGVQHARLELSPPEMGPLTVQIQLEGNTAQVHLAAENPHTRQALEQSMPLLAASLREAGLTLSGGGVFDQPRQAQPGHAQAAGSRRGNDATERDDGAPPIAALPTLRRRGVVDLIA